jgi:carbamoylphosphate synthase small subunit
VVAIAGLDTRRLTRVLREKGAQNRLHRDRASGQRSIARPR